MGRISILIYTIFYVSIANSIQLDNTKTFIVRIQNDLKPSVFTDVEHWYKATLGSLNSRKSDYNKFNTIEDNQDFLHVYKTVFHGFSTRLSPQEAQELETHPSVMAVLPDETLKLHTTRSIQFLGLDSNEPNTLLKESDYGSNAIIGILDTGISPESSSFHDQDLGPIPSDWKGECMEGEHFTKNLCNKKIIGARYFTAGYDASIGETNGSTQIKSSRDTDGHGTHTASTAAGRVVSNASLFGYAQGVAVGVAPKARIAVYKICWGENCRESDILAGIDKAVEDGVHVISISIGGSRSKPYHLDPIAIGAFGAMEKGVFVSASAGNSGPEAMSVTNTAPWITTVGASTIDRRFPADLIFDDRTVITGASLSTNTTIPETKSFPLIHAKNASTGKLTNSRAAICMPESLNKELVTGKIVICDRGGNPRVMKGDVVKKAGGIAVIVSNVSPQGEGLVSDTYTIPGMLITESATKKLHAYITSSKNPTAKIIIHGTRTGVKPAPIVASFSSRGPSLDSVYVLKPDVIAPGVDILAAWPHDVAPTEIPFDNRRTGFNIASGTSMSCPHVSGMAALLKGAHPDWSPAMIRSAIMTTAYMVDSEGKALLDEQSYNESSIWATGAGHVDPGKAVDPGLVYDITTDDYLQFLCAMNYTNRGLKQFSTKPVKCRGIKKNKPWNINYPAISIAYGEPRGLSEPEVVVTRTVTNVGEGVSNYNVTVTSPKGVNVTVVPQIMWFSGKGEKQSYTIKIVSDKVTSSWGSDNYATWSRSMRIALSVKNKLDFVEGSLPQPNQDDQAFRSWSRNNNVVISWILNSVSKEISSSIIYLSTAAEMWTELKECFKQSNGPRIFQIKRDLMNLSQGSDTVSTYFTKLKTLWEELSNYNNNCTCGKCTCGGAKEIEQTMSFLMRLNSSYAQVRGQILLMDPIPNVNRIFSLIIQEERQNNIGNSQTSTLAFNTRVTQNNNGGNKNYKNFRKDSPYCTHCKRTGHTQDKCYRLHGFPPGYRNTNQPRANSVDICNAPYGRSFFPFARHPRVTLPPHFFFLATGPSPASHQERRPALLLSGVHPSYIAVVAKKQRREPFSPVSACRRSTSAPASCNSYVPISGSDLDVFLSILARQPQLRSAALQPSSSRDPVAAGGSINRREECWTALVRSSLLHQVSFSSSSVLSEEVAQPSVTNDVLTGLTQQQCEGLISLLSGKLASVNMVTTSENLAGKYRILSLNSGNYLSNVWILDSGATQHICNDKSVFTNIKSVQGTRVRLPDHTLIQVYYKGDVQLTNELFLTDVLYVPQFELNLVSVTCLTRSQALTVKFYHDHTVIKQIFPNRMIGKGKVYEGLYLLDVPQSKSFTTVSANVAVSLQHWHSRFGHPSSDKIKMLSDHLCISNKDNSDSVCPICPLAKQKKLPFVSLNNVAKNPFDILHCDVWGLYQTSSHQGHKYFVTLVDDCTRFTWIYTMQNKYEVKSIIPRFLTMVSTQFKASVKIFRSDNAKELLFTDLFHEKGILHQFSCVERPQQNSVVERKHQHILNVAKALYFQSHVPIEYWSECVLTAVYLINRTPCKILNNATPYEKLYSEIPPYSSFKSFGCLAFSPTLVANRNKFEPRARACVLIGYPPGMKAYKLLDLSTREIFMSRDVIFHENVFPFTQSAQNFDNDPFALLVLPIPFQSENESTHSIPTPISTPTSNESDNDSIPTPISTPTSNESDNDSIPSNSVLIDPQPSTASNADSSTRPQRIRQKPSYLQDYHCNLVNGAENLIPSKLQPDTLCHQKNPKTTMRLQNMLNGNKLAMNDELQALELNNTWSIVNLPKDRKPLGCRWVYKIKRRDDGTVGHFKARLVAKGFNQQEVKLLLALAAKNNWPLIQLDVNNAFLNGDLEEEVYMQIPQGYSVPSSTTETLEVVPLMFLYLCTLMTLSSGASSEQIQLLKKALSDQFKLKDLGNLRHFLGLEIARSKSGIFISQRQYTLKLLEDMGLLGAKPTQQPMDPKYKLTSFEGEILKDEFAYRRLIGRLLYLTITRPDITYAVHRLSQYLNKPRTHHMHAANHLLRYLKSSPGQGLFLSSSNSLQLRAFSDADWAGCKATRRSVTGYCVFIGDSLISWRAKKQNTIARSSTEAEYRAIAAVTCELMWLRHLLHDFGVKQTEPNLVFCDNESAIKLASNPTFHERTKHVEIDCHFIRDKIIDKTVKLLRIRSKFQIADMFTKPLPRATLLPLMSKMSLKIQQQVTCASVARGMRLAAKETNTYIIQLTSPGDHIFSQLEDLESWYQTFLPTTSTNSNDEPQMVHAYRNVLTGFAAKLTVNQVKEMEEKDGIVSIRPQTVLSLHTTHTPNFLGLHQNLGFWRGSNYGKGIIVGVLDSGITPNHPSFNDTGVDPPPTKWKGKCEVSGCNNKLIGVRNFVSRSSSPLDQEGHGTHTSSTAAGNFVDGATALGNDNGTAVGIAPLAHVAMYKVCDESGCADTDMLAAMDAAIDDGVDVLSLSIGGPSRPFYTDLIAIGGFAAIQKGIFFSCSAGNSGPLNSTLSNEAPWILTVGASTVDRKVLATVKLGNGVLLDGESLFQPKDFPQTLLPLVYPGINGDPNTSWCAPGKLNNTEVKGKMVVCLRGGGIGRILKGQTVKDAGGAAMILTNAKLDGDSTIVDAHVIPASYVGYKHGVTILEYMNSTSSPVAGIEFHGTVIGDKSAPQVTSFSSRGPSKATPGILKPDIIGPGVSILAAWPVSIDNKTTIPFNVVSGTSMSCPHLSGIAALLKSAHPDWSPAAIKSAIMTTADLVNLKNQPIEDERELPANLFAVGSGHVNPSKASDPGLIYDIQPDDYIPYLCGLGYTSQQVMTIVQKQVSCTNGSSIPQAQLNYPSFAITLSSNVSKSYTRIVTNVGDANSSYTVTLSPAPGMALVVSPSVLAFTTINQKLSYQVTFIGMDSGPKIQFGEGALVWKSAKHSELGLKCTGLMYSYTYTTITCGLICARSLSGRRTNAQAGAKIREQRVRKTFGEDVGVLVPGWNMKDSNVANSNFVPHEMDVEFDMLCPLMLNGLADM
ncbi:hypothetical protein LXL04_005843 [Taraxacum kok-saghyz]